MSKKLSIDRLKEMCDVVTTHYCNSVGISDDQMLAYEAVMFYLGHPTANPAQWHEEWCELRKSEMPESKEPDEAPVKYTDFDPRLKPLAELDELEQIKYVVFINMFRTLRQLL